MMIRKGICMVDILMKLCQLLMVGVLIVQLSGCGTLLYPERRGQKSGQLDTSIVLLDGIGLFFFLIPGIIAFAVDFSNGTIYLPETSKHSSVDLKQIKFDPKQTDLMTLERIINDQAGVHIQLNQENVQITRLHSTEEMHWRFAANALNSQHHQLALIK